MQYIYDGITNVYFIHCFQWDNILGQSYYGLYYVIDLVIVVYYHPVYAIYCHQMLAADWLISHETDLECYIMYDGINGILHSKISIMNNACNMWVWCVVTSTQIIFNMISYISSSYFRGTDIFFFLEVVAAFSSAFWALWICKIWSDTVSRSVCPAFLICITCSDLMNRTNSEI